MTQVELARVAEMTHAQVSEIETGKRQPYPRTARKLADALGIDVSEILGSPDEPWGINWKLRRRADIWDASGGQCYYCGKTLHPFRNFHIDHIVAEVNGGPDTPDNLVAACRACNWDKRMAIDTPDSKALRAAGYKAYDGPSKPTIVRKRGHPPQIVSNDE
jgi:DNA-binding XRE family transcriptional regulator